MYRVVLKRAAVVCGFLGAALFLAASPAGALSISGFSVVLGATNSANDTYTAHTHNDSAASGSAWEPSGTVVVGTTAGAAAHYSSNLWADGDWGSEHNVSTTNSYDISMTWDAAAGIEYELTIDSLFKGVLHRVDDGYWDQSSASVSAVSVTLNGAIVPSLATTAQSLTSGYDNAEHAFSENGSHTLSGLTGSTTLAFGVSWTSNVDNTGGGEAAVLLGKDEAGGPVAGVSVGEYAALATPRDIAQDGHFINVTATVTAIPEPGTFALLSVGLLGLTFYTRRTS